MVLMPAMTNGLGLSLCSILVSTNVVGALSTPTLYSPQLTVLGIAFKCFYIASLCRIAMYLKRIFYKEKAVLAVFQGESERERARERQRQIDRQTDRPTDR